MTDEIQKKLSQMSKEDLIEIINRLCNNKTYVQKLSLLIAPTQKDLERAISQFNLCCDRCYCNSESESAFNALYEKADVLLLVADRTNVKMKAQIYHEIIRSIHSYQLYEYCDDEIVDYYYCAKDGIKKLIKEHRDEFSDALLKKYISDIDFDD
jgi:hypothetical protein